MTNRRAFLRGALGAGAAGVAAGAGLTAAFSGPVAAESVSERVEFHGLHQAGVMTRQQIRATTLAFDVQASDRAGLIDLMRTITTKARFLTAGGIPDDAGIATPPTDSGVLGPVVPPDRLTVTLGVGASLFDNRFGLAGRRPDGLTMMPTFHDDHLDPTQCHGDLSLQICAENEDTVGHAVREIARATRGAVSVKWRVDGFKSPPRPSGTPRNLLGFKDGTSNLQAEPAKTVDALVWLPDGGTFQVIRTIRMLVEFWDRIGISEQENLIGRRRDSGAPMDGNSEMDKPDFANDPTGEATPLTSHIRRANPRTPESAASRILRRPYNYDRGMDPVGDLDMGLLFISYQASLQKQFEAVQRRLVGEPLVDYIQPTGGGYFYVLPGVPDMNGFLGETLLFT
jgi:deferrochelatase/peroxidase EfeB